LAGTCLRRCKSQVNLLALESATERCSAALWHQGALIRRHWEEARPHSETLLPLVETLLGEAGIRPGQLDAVAFGMGPGAFTGLRMACGTAQGLALGAGIPVVPVPTLMGLAHQTGHNRVVAALDARMGQLYLAAYERRENQWDAILEAGLYGPESLPALPPGSWIVAGNALVPFGAQLREAWPDRMLKYSPVLHPDAAAVAELGIERFQQGLAVPPELASPLYLRDKVALTVAERKA
jgi:tRNA threonylcarbamoyladenosine biosynthesis protein TsaB